MQQTTLKQICDEMSQHLEFNTTLAKRINRYVGDLMNRNEAHTMFFGSNLTGVYPLRFKTSDRNEWFIDIKEDFDEFVLHKRVIKETGLPANWVRATDSFNIDCLYTIHRFINSSLPEKEKTDACEKVAMALNIKLMGAIMGWYFKHDVDERVAQEVYARLSRKFYIKRFGNWRLVLENRSIDIVSKTSKWYPVLKDFTDTDALAQCISDIQGRLRSMIKYIWEVFEQVRRDQSKFNRTSMALNVQGEMVLQDLKRDSDIYKRYILKEAMSMTTFVKPELLTIVDAEMRTMPIKLLVDALQGLSDQVAKNDTKTDQFLSTIVEWVSDMIQEDRTAARHINDLSWLLNKTKLLFTAAKASDTRIFEMRQFSEELIKKYAKTKNPTIIAALKTGLVIYIVARTFSMRHYN